MISPITSRMGATIGKMPEIVKIDGKPVVVSTLSAEIQSTLLIISEWEAQLRWHQLESNKLERAIKSLRGEVGAILGASQQTTESPQEQES